MEPIAITGIGCKLPGGIDSPSALWTSLLAAEDLITETPPDRWNAAAHYHPSRDAPGRTYSRWGGYVTDPAGFDAEFFGLSRREAARMDPQQRWLLEAAWESLEDAGVPPAALAGTGAGVYVGISSCDYGDIQKRGRYEVDVHTTSGSALSIASNRISYLFDLRGPSLSVDTACSSSLVALDLACRAVGRGEVPLALLGGANAILQPDVTVSFAKGGFLSPTGRCRAFDAAADGFVRAEGAAVVVLKPLARALVDGDRVYAVVRSTVTNQDGRTGGLTVPSAEQQQAMLERAYGLAGVTPGQVGYVEAHGTGTAVGDPIEAAALGRAIGVARPTGSPLWVGSVKSNLGHLEPASGVVGLIKLALALHHRAIPPNLHFTRPNPLIPFDEYRLRVPTAVTPWEAPSADGTLCGGVNSFGFGGTNAHAVLSSPPPAARPKVVTARLGPEVWTVSARSPAALAAAVMADAEFLATAEPARFAELAAAVCGRRSHHPHRVAVVADDAGEAAEKLRAVAAGGAMPAGVAAGQALLHAPPVALVFSGQGTQWPGMGRDLFRANPRFRATCEELDAVMRPSWGRSLVDELLRGDEALYQSDIGQPVLFAIQAGVYRLYADAGVRPAVVFGHSFGEVAAAHASGALTLAAAATVIVERAKALELTRGAGVMAAVGLSEAEAEPFLAAYHGRLSIAAFNSPVDLTLAGDEEAVTASVAAVAKQGRFARVLPFPYAFHSAAVERCRDVFADAVRGLPATRPSTPFVSAVTGAELTDSVPDEEYWWRNLRQPVRFAAATRRAAELGAKVFLEVGPHPGLVRYVRQVLGDAADVLVIGSLRRNEPGPRCLAESLATLHAFGVRVDWVSAGGSPGPYASFPKYPWQRQSYWAESEASRHARLTAPTHPLLGVRESGPGREWETCLSAAAYPYLLDHGFRGRAVFPAAGHLELMVAAAAGGSFADSVGLDDVRFDRPLWVDRPHVVRTALDPGSRRLTVSAQAVGEGAAWEAYSRGVHRAVDTTGAGGPARGGHAPPADAIPVSPDGLYTRFERAGHHYGPSFRTVRRLWARGAELWAEVVLPDSLRPEAGRYYLHPALLDGVLQSVLLATPVDEEREAMFLPVAADRVEWRRGAGPAVVCHVHDVYVQDVRWFADIDLFTPAGEWVATLTRCCCVKKPQEAHVARGRTKVYREAWTSAPRETAPSPIAGPWLIVDPSGAAGRLARRLGAAGAEVVHHVDDQGDPYPGFLTRATKGGTVVVWIAGRPRVEPSVGAAVDSMDPLLIAGKKLAGAGPGLNLWLVTSGATWGQEGIPAAAPDLLQATAAGLFRTVSTELPGVTCRLLDLDPENLADAGEDVVRELTSEPPEDEISYRTGRRFAAQLTEADPDRLGWRSEPVRPGAAFRLATTEPGSLDGLAWVEAGEEGLAPHEIEIDVRAAGLNFRDVLKALDAYPLAPTEPRSFGDEAAGVVRRGGPAVTDFRPGDEVVAVTVNGFGDRVRVPAALVAPKPTNLTFEQAAAVPIAFLTADYAVNEVARLQAGESVLVHSAAGGVGQAAVQVARRAGAEVLGTASPEKHAFLRNRGVTHTFHSRNLSFTDGVRAATGGRGVDVVLNSLSGEFIPRSLELLRPLGRFVEIGKKDIFGNVPLDLHPFRQGVSFHAVDLAAVTALKPEWVGRRLRAILDLFARGEYDTLPITRFPAARVGEAFRLMAQGKHRGKVVVVFAPAARPDRVLCHNRPVVRPDAAYLVTGGLSGFGLKTAVWLAEQGAKWLVLAGRSGAGTVEAEEAVLGLRARGARVEIVRCDVADPAAVERLVQAPQPGRPPLRGVVHSAMVLHDEPLARVDRTSMEKVLAPKLAGAWNLHRATRDLPLDWFVTYSSVATLLGSPGQASYVAANRFLDALAAARRAGGLPALSVNWGPLAQVGVVAENAALIRYLDSIGLSLLPPSEALRFLKFLLRRDVAGAGVVEIDWAKFADGNPKGAMSHRLARVRAAKADRAVEAGGSGVAGAILSLPEADRPAAVVDYLRAALAAVLRADPATLDAAAPLTGFGLDSLMAFEFKLKIDRELGVILPADRLSAGTTLIEVATVLCGQLTAPAAVEDVPPAVAPPAPVVPPPPPEPAAGTHLRLLTADAANGFLGNLRFDAAALLYVPDRVHSVGGVADDQLPGLLGHDPFVSHLYELPAGRIGVITLPVRGKDLFGSPRLPELVRRAAELARRAGARCLSLTGLIPSATDYGLRVRDWVGDHLRVTTGHATTTAAVVLNLRSMLATVGRRLEAEHLAVLGLGSIGRSCLALTLEVLPHPREITLCDVFAKQDAAAALAREVRHRHGYRGAVRVLASERGVPDGVYKATTLLTAVSVPAVLDVSRFRPGTVVVDDSYPPGFPLDRAIRRAEADADLFFANAGMARLPDPIRETVFLPPGAEKAVAQFGPDAFCRELARDPRELTACILSSLLTDRLEGFRATLGLADLDDLRSHYHGLERLGITASRPQCGTYFVPDEVISRFRERYATTAGGRLLAESQR
jgi:acyl transferase domain-containing protein/acyl carrier protein